MPTRPDKKSFYAPESLPFSESHYRDVKRKNVIRLLITYLGPLLVLAVYFYFQYGAIYEEGRRLHLRAIAENQANTLDLFLTERLVNLSNLIDDPKFTVPPTHEAMQTYLEKLSKNSRAFVDIDFFDSTGVRVAYAGPFPSIEERNYSTESWYVNLKQRDDNFIITDIYLGFRRQPHFTIAVSRVINGRYVVLRSTLSPEKLNEYIISLEGSHEVYSSIVNKEGFYQVVTSHIGTPLDSSTIVPPEDPKLGVESVVLNNTDITYAYSWLRSADWALIVQWSSPEQAGFLTGYGLKIIGVSLAIVLVIVLIIFNRAKQLVEFQKESDRTRAQLEHAAKLATVGELAAGIAHEINNPLAIISEEAGLMKDLMNPEFGDPVKPEDLHPHLDNIHESVFRCRDITRKLLGFVRKTDLDLRPHDVHDLINGVIDGFLQREMAVSNIEITRNYGRDIPRLLLDSNQFQQVILNLINNASDAIGGQPGSIKVATSVENNHVHIAVSDSGRGMDQEQLTKIFMPFYTTKEVGKGTGLGLSVSYGIIKSFGGKIEVSSKKGKGSTFTIVLPVRQK